jgi:tetratricopeptide (TPR) repeat protein
MQQSALRRSMQEACYLMAAAQFRQSRELRDVDERQTVLAEALEYNRRAREIVAAARLPAALVWQQSQIEAELGHQPVAANLADVARGMPQGDALDRYLLAVHCAGAGDYSRAIEILDDLSSQRPADYFVRFLLGTCHYAIGDFGAAESWYSGCTALWPESHLAFFHRGVVRFAQRRLAESEQDFVAVVKREPTLRAARMNLALVRIEQGKFREASDDLTGLIRDQQGDSFVYLLRSRAERALGNIRLACADRALGLRLRPTDAEGWIQRGLERVDADPAGALADFQQALALDPTSQPALQNCAFVLSDRLGQWEAAQAMLDRILQLDPHNAMVLGGRGVLNARRGQRDAAVRDAHEALRLDASAQSFYQAACILSLTSKIVADDAAQAVRLLAESLKRDVQCVRQARNDADLQPLAAREDFAQLIAAASRLQEAEATATEP